MGADKEQQQLKTGFLRGPPRKPYSWIRILHFQGLFEKYQVKQILSHLVSTSILYNLDLINKMQLYVELYTLQKPPLGKKYFQQTNGNQYQI